MDRILFINGCIRRESRTLRLAKHLLCKLDGEVQEVNLEREGIPALTGESLAYRQGILEREEFDDPMLRYARQFRQADVIVIAAPYYDLSFSSNLKNYLEAICCVGLTFYYDEHEVAQTLCRARKLYFVSTGGSVMTGRYGYEYVRAVAEEFFRIPQVHGFLVDRLDLMGSDPEGLLQEGFRAIDAHFSGTVYNKLVRDKIPEIIAAQGFQPRVRVLAGAEYGKCLADKLDEEVAEYHREGTLEELADILEVAFSLGQHLGCSREELLDLCQEKRKHRGGFEKGIYLISKE